ncbi:MAG: 1-acyl-sn-glycerol-3-phosphate acyltransferase [Bacteroidia bacterium]|nr:1-acyl-sn-glycerol-3-phosphate acyltransferase [Bacteroidia bacterium]
MNQLLYQILKCIAKIIAPFYFSSIEINGLKNISKSGPIIFAPNHQNAFLDAIVVAMVSPRPIYFLARASVFSSIFNRFLRAINMRPVFRIRDGYESLSKNAEVFDECSKLLSEGKTLLLFPEADHGIEYYLRPLSRGLSRIAYQGQLATDSDVQILPVGINYFDHVRSGSKLTLNFGEPLKVKEFITNDFPPGHIYNEIRTSLSLELKKVMVIPDKADNYGLKKSSLKDLEHLDFDKLRMTLGEDENIQKPNSPIKKYLRSIFYIPNAPFYLLVKAILKKKVKDPIFHASIKYAFAMLASPIWLGAIFLVIFKLYSLKVAICVLFIQIVSALLRVKLV